MSHSDDLDGEQWRRLAMDTRTVLDLLGYDLPSCLPGEDQACGHSFQEHAAANLGALRVVANEQIVRLRLEDAEAVMTGLRTAHDTLAAAPARPRIKAPCPWPPRAGTS